MEKILLTNLDEANADPVAALWQLAQFYKVNKQHEKALARLRQLIQLLPDLEDKAECVFTMGQAMEQVADYRAAVAYYKEALALEPTGSFTWYFINNNLGFSLNTLGDFAEGEIYCRRAIDIDGKRPNAFKNLGIALAGQCQYQDAARAFVNATQVNAADSRAFRLLETLLKDHPELEYDFQDDLDCCRAATEAVAKKSQECTPVIRTGWRKQLILSRMRLQSILRQLRGLFHSRA
jgi:tetratricopeptide (TPR) repeat protein